MSELDRVYASLMNSGGGDGVPSRETDFEDPGNEPRCAAWISKCIDACVSSGDSRPSGCIGIGAELEALRGW